MNFLPLIERKRDGSPLTAAQIQDAIRAYTAGQIPDYQMSAFLMAVFFRGMSREETAALTLAMRDSGEVLKFPDDPRPIVDKHSTGGVGDKVSLPLAPLLACLGFRVPMISGRGLGITGGTLDKLESIPGLTTQLDRARLVAQVQRLGVAMGGQTATMIPADKKIYALRDVTGTVPSIPLITASILSKKLAESLHALIMDVKFGTAAFMQTREAARELARSIVTLAHDCGVNTRALLTDMNTPLGRAAGNWLEVKESVACLEGKGPEDLRQLVVECAAHLAAQTMSGFDLAITRRAAVLGLESGDALRKWEELIVAQGADLAAYRAKLKLDHAAPVVLELVSDREGFVSKVDSRIVGEIVRDLGGGRMMKDSAINPDVGIDSLAKPGESMQRKSLLARVHAATQAEAEAALLRLRTAFEFSEKAPQLPPLVHEVISA
ncbi:MAG: thymidine phosphorylase [Verrucomicrobia bacterium]|nr:thymidine phosphorylase [Verrucomicrobiota bacterium]